MLCKNNWIDVSWDGLPSRRGKENLQVTFYQKTESIKSFQTVCDHVAIEIAGQHSNLFLALSGGSDSEHIANVLLRNKIQFTPLIVDYDHCHDPEVVEENWWAKHWCKQHKIQPVIVKSNEYIGSLSEKQRFLHVKARLLHGVITAGIIHDAVTMHQGTLLTGNQLEYYPDYEQMTYLESQLGDYEGFVMQESDMYNEILAPNQHPWAFYYWNADIVAAFVNEWNTGFTIQENKAAIYGTSPRPKIGYRSNFPKYLHNRHLLARSFGDRDVAMLGTKQSLLEKLVK